MQPPPPHHQPRDAETARQKMQRPGPELHQHSKSEPGCRAPRTKAVKRPQSRMEAFKGIPMRRLLENGLPGMKKASGAPAVPESISRSLVVYLLDGSLISWLPVPTGNVKVHSEALAGCCPCMRQMNEVAKSFAHVPAACFAHLSMHSALSRDSRLPLLPC